MIALDGETDDVPSSWNLSAGPQLRYWQGKSNFVLPFTMYIVKQKSNLKYNFDIHTTKTHPNVQILHSHITLIRQLEKDCLWRGLASHRPNNQVLPWITICVPGLGLNAEFGIQVSPLYIIRWTRPLSRSATSQKPRHKPMVHGQGQCKYYNNLDTKLE